MDFSGSGSNNMCVQLVSTQPRYHSTCSHDIGLRICSRIGCHVPSKGDLLTILVLMRLLPNSYSRHKATWHRLAIHPTATFVWCDGSVHSHALVTRAQNQCYVFLCALELICLPRITSLSLAISRKGLPTDKQLSRINRAYSRSHEDFKAS